MNKGELIEAVKANLGTDASKALAERAVEAVLEGIKAGIKKDSSVQLIGFGTFTVAKRAARKGRNPRTGKEITIPASKVAKFTPGKGLKDAIK